MPSDLELRVEDTAIIVTKDEDFSLQGRQRIVWLRIGNSSRRALLQWFEPLLPQIVKLMEQGEKMIEMR